MVGIALIVGIAGGLLGGYLGGGSKLQKTTDTSSSATYKAVASEEALVIDMVKRVSPSVVSVVATQDLPIFERGQYCDDSFFNLFYGYDCPDQSGSQKTTKQQVAAGTGFIISPDGLILTNRHVVEVSGRKTEFTVVMGEKKYTATILAKDPIHDLALLKISAQNLPSLKLGNSDDVEIGQTVIAIGNALGQFSNTVSKGVVSGLARSLTASTGRGSSERLDRVIQTDAAINPGNSGGPLLNISGEVIGVNSAIVQGAQNIGFAIPINQATRDIEQVKSTGKISYGFLGVQYSIVPDGAQIGIVVDGSPADQAGMVVGDIVTHADGKQITDDYDLSRAIQILKAGDTIHLRVVSGGVPRNLDIVLTERQ